MVFWEGEKVRLRGIEPEDAAFFYDWNQETSTQRSLAWIWFPTSRASVEQWAREESLKKGEGDQYFFVIDTLSGSPVGSISTNNVMPVDKCFRYGVGIIETERQKGYAKDAITILLRYYFGELGYHKVNAAVYSFNTSSIELHRKLGFQQEGCLREAKFTQNKFWDILIFGMTATEFYETNPNLQ